MCGIAGIITANESVISIPLLKKMADALKHRGPDGEDFWINKHNHAGFAHRRLSIIDLSPSGAQPMHYLQRYTIVFNGEIYNYIELRADLQKAGYHFQSTGDTEVILAAYDLYKERCLQHFDGMFAFAIWDEKQQKLFCARDRFGEKPLYYYNDGQVFAFASEMKALWATGIEKKIEEKQVLNYIALGQVQNPSNKAQTFYRNIYSLPPSSYAILPLQTLQLSVKPYWEIDKQYNQQVKEADAKSIIESLLTISVHRRLRSDVAIGASISGGLDSSAIAYFVSKFLSEQSNKNFKTFSAVFPGFEKDEHKQIEEVTKFLHLKNYPLTPDAKGLISDFEKLCYHQEEPFTSSSIYAQYKVYQHAKENDVKVLLDGQGADETMAGYHRYIHWYLQELVSLYKFSEATHEKRIMHQHKANFKWGIKNIIGALLPSHVSIALEKKEYNHVRHNADLSKHMIGFIRGREWDGIHKPVVTKLNDILHFSTMEMGLEELLRYADRNSMAHGIEVRLPFLNAELVKFIFSLSSKHKINEGYTKSILRKVMNGKLPHDIVWRKDKVGFEPPQKEWMNDATIKEYIFEAKQKLVNERILKDTVLTKKIHAAHAHEARNADWRYLCLAHMMNK